jgi:hypothetical protein
MLLPPFREVIMSLLWILFIAGRIEGRIVDYWRPSVPA